MMWFIVGIIICIIVIIVCIFILKKLSLEEKEYMEVSDQYLKNIGKDYNKDMFASWATQTYINIIQSVMNEDYNFLRDILSDDLYNNYLIGIKNCRDRRVKSIVDDIKPIFSKLVNLKVQGDTEIAKVWMKLSYIEYVKDISPLPEDAEVTGDRIISGSKNNRLEKEYILTFVKVHTPKETVVCPNCGNVSKIIDKSLCIKCSSNIVPRQYHWVMIGKEEHRI